jgi:MFS family permease
MATAGSRANGGGVAPARAWYAVGILLLMYCLSFVDRMILAVLAPLISASLHITDTQIGLLFGLGFGVLYSVIGLPLAQIADRSHRVRLIAAGVFIWSVCTIASGFAATFGELLIMRCGVAIGEATLSPAVISIIADMFPREKRTLPTTVYMSAGAVMSSGAFIIGGLALDLAHVFTADVGLVPWRLAIVFVGIPGLLLSPLLLLTVREPKRRLEANAADLASARQALRFIAGQARLYGFLFVGKAAYMAMFYGYTAWTATILVRGFGMTPQKAGYVFGTIGATLAIVSTGLAPYLARRWERTGRRDSVPLVLAFGIAASSICAFVIGISRSEPLTLTMIFCFVLCGGCAAVLPPLIIQYVTPGPLRGRVMAGNLLAINLVGLGLGPLVTAWIADTFFEGPFALASSLAIVAVLFGTTATIAVFACRKGYLAALDAMQQPVEAPSLAQLSPQNMGGGGNASAMGKLF